MEQTIGVWGNNHAVRIPKNIDNFQTGDKVHLNMLEDGSILLSPTTRHADLSDLLQELDDLKWHYMELIECTSTAEIDPVAQRAHAKISAYREFVQKLDNLRQRYIREVG
jgi:antitoxin component of MazEF toxin-antitoxin module